MKPRLLFILLAAVLGLCGLLIIRPFRPGRPTLPPAEEPNAPAPLVESPGEMPPESTLEQRGSDSPAQQPDLAPALARSTPTHDAPPDAGEPTHPPGMMPPPDRMTLAGQVDQFVSQMKAEGGPEQFEKARSMLGSDDPLVQTAGAAVLAASGRLQPEDLAPFGNLEHVAFSLEFLGWLQDHGNTPSADILRGLLREAGLDLETLANLLESGTVQGSGGRAALNLLTPGLEDDEALHLLGALASSDVQDYTVRIQALWHLRDHMPFEAYREKVVDMAASANPGDPGLREGLDRLARSLQGPVPVIDRPPLLSPQQVDGLFARPYAMLLEDVFQQIDYTLRHPEGQVVQGTADRLRPYIGTMSRDPHSPEEGMTLKRLERLAEEVETREGRGPPLVRDPNLPPGV